MVIKIFTVQEAINKLGSNKAFAEAVGIHSQHTSRHLHAKLVAVNDRGEYTLVKNEEFWCAS